MLTADPSKELGKRKKRTSGQSAGDAYDRVVQGIGAMCESLRPGDRIPTHTDLMARFDVSERIVLTALRDLQREGRIERRSGSGTFVAEPVQTGDADTISLVPGAAATDSRTVVALWTPDHAFFDRCASVLSRKADAAGISLVSRHVEASGPRVFALAPGEQPLGYILFAYKLAPLALALQNQGCRAVVVGDPPADVTPEVPCVCSDHEQGGHRIVRHLLDLGHRRIAFTHSGGRDVRTTRRWQGAKQALAEAERETGATVETVFLSEETIESWRGQPALAATFLRRPDAPTAIAVWNDREAALMLSVLNRAGVRVPDEVSLTGYDAMPEGELVYPPLTTVDQAMEYQLSAALNLLLRPTPPPPSHTVVVLPTLIRRESSGPPKAVSETALLP